MTLTANGKDITSGLVFFFSQKLNNVSYYSMQMQIISLYWAHLKRDGKSFIFAV